MTGPPAGGSRLEQLRVDVRKYEFLSGSLLSAVRLIDGCPVLGTGFEIQFLGCTFLVRRLWTMAAACVLLQALTSLHAQSLEIPVIGPSPCHC